MKLKRYYYYLLTFLLLVFCTPQLSFSQCFLYDDYSNSALWTVLTPVYPDTGIIVKNGRVEFNNTHGSSGNQTANQEDNKGVYRNIGRNLDVNKF